MLATLIAGYDKKSFHFKSKRLTEMSNVTFYDCINTIYQYIKPFFFLNKMSIFEEYGAFKARNMTSNNMS